MSDGWQYTTLQFLTAGVGDDAGAADLEGALNEHGAAGWELVSTTVYHNAEAQQHVLLCVFKRPRELPGRLNALTRPEEPPS
jgi:hypothetical protein